MLDKRWACSTFTKLFPSLSGAVVNKAKAFSLKQQQETGPCLLKHLTAPTGSHREVVWAFLLPWEEAPASLRHS